MVSKPFNHSLPEQLTRLMQKEEFMRTVMVHKDKMYRFALSFIANAEESRDVVQDVLMKLWETRGTLSEVKNMEAWCMTMVRNKCLDRLKRASHKLRVAGDNGEVYEKNNAHFESPERVYQNKELGTIIERAMETLPEKHRTAFHLRDVQGYSYMEISDLLQIDINQVKVNIFRARKSLQAALQNTMSDEH